MFKSSKKNREWAEVLFYVGSIAAVLLFGSLGYVLLEHWNWFDSFYMAVITLATVGYQEIHPLSTAGRAFTIVLIFVGVGVASVVIGSLARKFIDREVHWIFDRENMQDKIKEMKDHTIVCGFGRLSRNVAQQLKAAGAALVVIDRDPVRQNQAREAGFLVVNGDATAEESLSEAGIKQARRLLTLLPKDAENLYVVLTSRELNSGLFIVSRAEDEAGEKRLKRAGANQIISPYRAAGQKIAYGILRPFVADFIDVAVSGSRPGFLIEEIKIPPRSPLSGQTLQQIGLRQKTNVIIAAVISNKGEMQFNPSGDAVLETGSTLIGLGLKKDFEALERLLVGN